MAETFAGLLRRYRRDAGLSQEALAESSALSKDAVSALERGTRRAPYRDTVELLARALHLDDGKRFDLEAAAARGRAERLHSGDEESPPSNLPRMATTLVGRDEAVEALVERLAEHRIVTIVGTGGVGKTRVALEAAERFMRGSRGGVWFVDLAAITRGATVFSKIASAAGVAALGSDDELQQLTAALHAREGLVVLDNCEHVIEEAAKAAAAIASGCPGLKVLATSRERLALRGESVYHLGPLDKAAAGELFRMRASSAGLSLTSADKTAIDEICGEVDNIPLAIELAAARGPLLGLSELRARLQGQLTMLSGGVRDAPARQRAMHETIGWSHDLLDATERAVFRRLAVFADGWSLAALAPVVLAPPFARDALPAFTSLVEKSLVVTDLEADPARYRLLEPIRAFAAEQLRAADELDLCQERHARWMADFAEATAQSEAEGNAPEFEGRALRELDNARAALEWSLQSSGDLIVGARIVGRMRTCWLTPGLLAELRRWCELILERLDVDAHPAVAAQVFRSLVSASAGRRAEQTDAVRRGIPVLESAGDWSGLIAMMSLLMLRDVEDGQLDDAQRTFDRIEALREEYHVEPNSDWITVLMHRGYLLRLRNQFDEAAAVFDEGIALARKLRRPFHEMWTLLLAGEMAFALGDGTKAIAIASDTIAKSQKNRHVVIEIFARSNLAGYYIAGGDVERARAEARAAILRGSNVEAYVLTSAILHLATAAALSGIPREAARLKGYCDARNVSRKMVQDPSEIASRAMLTAALEARLSVDEIAELEREGALLGDNEATQLAADLARDAR